MVEWGSYTYAEIMSQSETWQAVLAVSNTQKEAFKQLWLRGQFDRVIFTGCGSTYYLSLMGARLFQQLTGVPSQAYPASELVLFPESVYLPKTRTLLIAVSRSGETTETVEAVRAFRQQGEQVVTVCCYSESRLPQKADLAINIDAAREDSIAQTRSFSSMAVVVQALAAWVGQGVDAGVLAALPDLGGRLLKAYEPLARKLGEDMGIQRFFFLGSSARYGIASEAMLKMKEMSLAYSEVFHTLEFRHGPMSMVTNQALVVGLLSDSATAQETAVLSDMQARGARILAIGEGDSPFAHAVRLQSGVPEWARTILYLPVLQLLAYYRAMANGKNPDRPENLDAVVSLKSLK